MSGWIDVAPVEELPPGSSKTTDVDGVPIAVFNVGGTCYAIEDRCTHDGGVLTGGEVQGDVVVCPRHGARFCIRTGKAMSPPAYEDVPTFDVRIDSGIVQVRDSRWDGEAD
jgi:3-phenylpropionate/trans-cinnamate dioxygenase ferredoxin subunit